MANISSDAQKVLDKAGAGASDYVLSQGGFGDKLTSGEAQRLLAGFDSSAYSGENVLSAVSDPVSYDYSDPYGAWDSIAKNIGYEDAQSAEQEATKALLDFRNETREGINALRANRDLSTGLEQGFESERTREATQQEQVLTDALTLASNKRMALESRVNRQYDVFQNELNKREALYTEALGYGADVDINMSISELTKKLTKAKEEKEEELREEEYRDNLKETLLSLGISTKTKKGGTLNTSKMEKALKKYYGNKREYEDKINSLKLQTSELQLQKLSESLSTNDIFSNFNWKSLYDAWSSASGGSSSSLNINSNLAESWLTGGGW